MTSFHQDKPLLMLPWKYHSLVIASMMLMAMIMLQNVMMVMLRENQILFNLGKSACLDLATYLCLHLVEGDMGWRRKEYTDSRHICSHKLAS